MSSSLTVNSSRTEQISITELVKSRHRACKYTWIGHTTDSKNQSASDQRVHESESHLGLLGLQSEQKSNRAACHPEAANCVRIVQNDEMMSKLPHPLQHGLGVDVGGPLAEVGQVCGEGGEGHDDRHMGGH